MKIKVIITVVVVALFIADAGFLLSKLLSPPPPETRLTSAIQTYEGGDRPAGIKRLAYVVDTDGMLSQQDSAEASLLLSTWYGEAGDDGNMYKYFDKAVAAKTAEISGITLDSLPKAPLSENFDKGDFYKASGTKLDHVSDLMKDSKIKDKNIICLDLSAKRLADLTGLSDIAGLTAVNLSRNAKIDLNTVKEQPLSTLNTISLSGCSLTDISAFAEADLPSLAYLDLSKNKLKAADLAPLASLTSLQVLILDGNALGKNADLSFLSGLPNLRLLSLAKTGYTNVAALSQLHGLISLDISDNGITTLDYDVEGGVSTLPYELPYLMSLNVSGNKLTALPDFAPQYMRCITQLDISGNNLADLTAFSGAVGLTDLNASANKITDVSPIAGLTRLKTLDLSKNKIADLSPVRALPNSEDFVLPKETGTAVDSKADATSDTTAE